MVHHFMDTLPELRMLVGEEFGTHAVIPRAPALSAIVGPIHAAGRDCDEHSLWVGRIEHNGMQAEPAAAGLPPGLVLVVEQSVIRLPRLPAVA
jgi:hypothetical protein